MALNRGKCTRICSRSRSQPWFAVGRGNVGRANVLGVPFSLLAAIATNDIAILRKISFIFFSKMYNNWQPAFNYSIMYNYLVNGVNHNILLPKFTKSTHVVLSVFLKYLLFKIRKISITTVSENIFDFFCTNLCQTYYFMYTANSSEIIKFLTFVGLS